MSELSARPRPECSLALGSSKSAEQPGLPLPNELIYNILEYLPAPDLIHAGHTCQQLRAIVNNPHLSTNIVHWERQRILDSQHCSSLAGLSVLDAFREWIYHHGRLETSHIFNDCNEFAAKYKSANGIKAKEGDRREAMFVSRLSEYLYHLDHAAHYDAGTLDFGYPLERSTPRCHCGYCSRQLHYGGMHCWIEQAVRKFGVSTWTNYESPEEFYNEVATDAMTDVVTLKQWLDMVKSVLQEPIQQFTASEAEDRFILLFSTAYFGLWSHGFEHSDTIFALAGLPKLQKGNNYYMLKSHPALAERVSNYVRGGGRVKLDLGGVIPMSRAFLEICDPSSTSRRKVVDPEGRLLRAFIFEQTQVIPGSWKHPRV